MSKLNDLTGQKFGMLTVIKRGKDYISPKGNKRVQWLCKCDCGNKELILVASNNLTSKHTKSCGCLKEVSPRFNDITGKKFNRWNVLKRGKNSKTNNARWWCWCDCQKDLPKEDRKLHLLSTSQLNSKRTNSCGCYQRELFSILKTNNKYSLKDHSVNNDDFWTYKVGENIKTNTGNIQITKRYYEDGNNIKSYIGKYYYYHCNICHYESTDENIISESNLKQGHGCCCCGGKIVTSQSPNALSNAAPWLIPFLTDREDGNKYSIGSRIKISTTCINCNFQEDKIINHMYRNGYHCKCCDDGYSIPEKFMMCLFDQLKIKYISQLSKKDFKWIGKYRYDFYLLDYNCIVETHGEQHYSETFGIRGATKSLKEIRKTDRLKQELALKNGVEKYIIIDTRYSKKEWLQSNIEKSLTEFDLSQIDYNKCMEFALKTRVKDVCEDYKNSKLSIKDLTQKYSLHSCTIRTYLKQGTDLNWCNYNMNEEKLRARKNNKKCRRIKAYKNEEYLGEFDSIVSFVEYVFRVYNIKLSTGAVSDVCRGNNAHTKSFICAYID